MASPTKTPAGATGNVGELTVAIAIVAGMLAEGVTPTIKNVSRGMAVVRGESSNQSSAHNDVGSGHDGYWQFDPGTANACGCQYGTDTRNIFKSSRCAARCYKKCLPSHPENGWYCNWDQWDYNQSHNVTTKDQQIASHAIQNIDQYKDLINRAGSDFPLSLAPQGAQDAVKGALGGAVDVGSAILQFVGLIRYLFEPSFWLRMAKLIGGFLLLAYGVSQLGKALLGIDLGKAAMKFAPAAKAL